MQLLSSPLPAGSISWTSSSVLCLRSLQELLLCPVWRLQEYATLIQALRAHTPAGHPDRTHLSSALSALLRFRELVQEVPHSSAGESFNREAANADLAFFFSRRS